MPFTPLQVLKQQNGCWAAEASSAGCRDVHCAAQDTRLPGTCDTRAPEHMPGRTATALSVHATLQGATSEASPLQVLSILDDTSSAALLKVLRQAAAAGSQSGPRAKKGNRSAGMKGGKARGQRQQSPDVAAEDMQWEAGSQDQAEGSSQGDSTAMEQLSSEDCQALMQVRNLQGFWHIRCLHSDCDTAVEPGGDGGLGPLRRIPPSSLHGPCLFCASLTQSHCAKRADKFASLNVHQVEAGN